MCDMCFVEMLCFWMLLIGHLILRLLLLDGAICFFCIDVGMAVSGCVRLMVRLFFGNASIFEHVHFRAGDAATVNRLNLQTGVEIERCSSGM
jgi:hypothetical protein